jgi:hypothetical protein
MKPTMIVWDLETVPDLSGFAAAHDLVGKSNVEIRGESFWPLKIRRRDVMERHLACRITPA